MYSIEDASAPSKKVYKFSTGSGASTAATKNQHSVATAMLSIDTAMTKRIQASVAK